MLRKGSWSQNINTPYTVFYLKYPSDCEERLLKIVEIISKIYVTFKHFPYSLNIKAKLDSASAKFKLTKRRIVFAILTP